MSIRMEMTDKLKLPYCGIPLSITTMSEDFYMLCCSREEKFNIFNRSNLREVKHVIHTRDYNFESRVIVACNPSSCVFVLSNKGKELNVNSVERITKDDEHQFVVSPWISDLTPDVKYIISVSPEGSLILSRTEGADTILRIYAMDGSLKQEIRLSLDLFYFKRIIPKSSGNLVFVSLNYEFKKQLTETNLDGNVVKTYDSSLMAADVDYADAENRFLLVGPDSKMELLDSQFNPLRVTPPTEAPSNRWAHPTHLHYD